MKINEFFEDLKYYVYNKGIRRLIPKYHDRTIFTKFFWRTWWDKKTKGFDETETWSMDYSLARLIAPRLKMFIEEFDYHHICANYCHNIVRDQLIAKGYKYDSYHYRFENKKIRNKAYKMAADIWHQDLMTMYEAFQDIIEENDDWENWTKKYNAEAKALNKKLDKLKTLKEKKEFWESIVEFLPYNPSTCRFTSAYVSLKIRKEGLKLFGEHFQELWW